MNSSLKQTRDKGTRTLIAIFIMGVAVYLGFTPLFDLIKGGYLVVLLLHLHL